MNHESPSTHDTQEAIARRKLAQAIIALAMVRRRRASDIAWLITAGLEILSPDTPAARADARWLELETEAVARMLEGG